MAQVTIKKLKNEAKVGIIKYNVKWFINLVLAACTVFVILNILAYFYYSLPQKELNSVRTSDFVLEANYSGYIMDEGLAKFSTDENGYNNDIDIDKQNLDILVMGSSHTLGYNVNRNENYASVLRNALRESDLSDLSEVYNIGMWGHTWYALANNFDDAYKEYHPTKYIIMELHDGLDFSVQNLQKVLNRQYPREGFSNNKIIRRLQKFPFIQLALHQLKNAMVTNAGNKTEADTSVKRVTQSDYTEYEKVLEQVIVGLKEKLSASQCKLIILYQPHLVLNKDGTAEVKKLKEDYAAIFQAVCQRNNVIYCDVSQEFLENYKKNYQMPHGFNNTAVGVGHLNKFGHKIIGEKLFKMVKEDQKIRGLK